MTFLQCKYPASLLLLIIAISVVSCSQIRTLTYPKEFTYLEKKEVETLMQSMGQSVERLDNLVSSAATSDVSIQDKIVDELTALKSIASRLSSGQQQTNHLVISDRIEEFINDVEEARLFASDNPPNYFNAGKLTGSCLGCHRFRQGNL